MRERKGDNMLCKVAQKREAITCISSAFLTPSHDLEVRPPPLERKEIAKIV